MFVPRVRFLVAFSTHRVLIWTKWTNEGAWKNFQSKIWLQTQCIRFLPQLQKVHFVHISNLCQILVAKKYAVKIYQICAKSWLPKCIFCNYISFMPNYVLRLLPRGVKGCGKTRNLSRFQKQPFLSRVVRFIQHFHFLCFDT